MTAVAASASAAPPDTDVGVADTAPDAGVLPAPKLAILFLGVVAGLQAVDPTIASTALVRASRGLGMEGGLLALAASISTLALAATVISAGMLGARIGWRRLLVGGLLVSVVGDLLVAAAPASSLFLAGRAITGVGLGAAFAAAFAYIRVITPAEHMARAIGVFTAVGSAVLVAFSLLGGVLASVDWRIAFVLVPFGCAACALATVVVLPRTGRSADGPIDLPGQVLLALGIVGVLFGLSHLSKGVTRPICWVPMVLGVLLLAGFAVVERRSAHPFFPVQIFRHPLFLGAMCAGFVYNFANSAAVLQFSDLWQYVSDLSPIGVSLGLLPFLLVGVVSALVTGRLLTKGLGDGAAVLLGGGIVALGGVATLLHPDGGTYWTLLPSLLLIGFGSTMAAIPYGGLIVRSASGKLAPYYGPITSSRTTFGQIAYALGLSLSTVLVDHLTTGGVVRRLNDSGVPPSRTGGALDMLGTYVRTGRDPSTAAARRTLATAKESYTASFQLTMVAVGVLCLVAGLLAVAVLRRGAQERVSPS